MRLDQPKVSGLLALLGGRFVWPLIVFVDAFLAGELGNLLQNTIGGCSSNLLPGFRSKMFNLNGLSNADFKFSRQNNVSAGRLQPISADQAHRSHGDTGA